ncbi:hypothetical protein KP509_24G000400 [Ceratopteris richardii]|nr:hypothetical protein KP509_24G000400 [Ceratopteris richardii]
MASFEGKNATCTSIILHPLADLSSSHPSVFVYDLKQNFFHSKGKSTAKFHAIRKQIIQSLPTSPEPGPATFVARCLEALKLLGCPHNEGFGHLLTCAFNRVGLTNCSPQDSAAAKKIAASSVYSILKGETNLGHRITAKIIVVFDVQLSDIADVMNIANDKNMQQVEALIEPLVISLIKSHSYNIASSLTKHLNLPNFSSEDFLARMVDEGDERLAGQWACHLGKDILCCLVHYCINAGMFKEAYKYVQNYQLSSTFPEARRLYKQSCLPVVLVKDTLGKARATADDGLPSKSPEEYKTNYLQLNDIISIEKVIWVDTQEGLNFATKHFNEVSVVGIDCEWKSVRARNVTVNKVSILQIATHEYVFVMDLLRLSEDHGSSLNMCIQSIFLSNCVLKLGYAIKSDLELLVESYSELECFCQCKSVLDLRSVVGTTITGGLSGLAKVVSGKGIDKEMRMTDWERRPLSTQQLHYAALDAGVLLFIFDRIEAIYGRPVSQIEWKQHVALFKARKICSEE